MEGQEPRLIPVHVAEKALQDMDTALMGARTLEDQVFKAKSLQAQALAAGDRLRYDRNTSDLESKEKALALARTEAQAVALSIAKKALEDWMTPGTPRLSTD